MNRPNLDINEPCDPGDKIRELIDYIIFLEKKGEYFLDRDNDGHWYIIEESKREEWNNWLDLDSDDEESWSTPDFAKSLDGGPSQVVFSNYELV